MALGKVMRKPHRYGIEELRSLMGESSEVGSHVFDVRNRLLRVIQVHILAGRPPWLAVPSVKELAPAFHCTDMDVLEALYELTQQGYDFRLSGLDRPVILSDPYAGLYENVAVPSLLKKA